MSALTQDSLHPVQRQLTPEQLEARRRNAEIVLGHKLPPRKTRTETSQGDQ
ncbi:hypothetical protein [Nocardia tengchongensis]|uniref:hypothetical protein n=1 Tax=Nocardia tengchongensis TaxID=2055889 RepID=UPI003619B305